MKNKPAENKKSFVQTAMRVSVVSIIVNILLSLLKLFTGIFANSSALISDAVHSASDVFSTFVVMIGVSISGKDEDEEHPYGHERMECVASIILSVLLAVTGAGIGLAGIKQLTVGNIESLPVPGAVALVIALVSIVVKEGMYRYTKAAAKKINSGALMADAWHHRSDALSSIGAFAGILGARLGFPALDPIAGIIICIFIIKAAFDIFKDSMDKMVDKACPEETVKKMSDTILDCREVISIDELKTRLFGSRIYVDVEIAVDPEKSLIEAHSVAEQVHDAIEKNFPEVKHCTVHVNPHISQ